MTPQAEKLLHEPRFPRLLAELNTAWAEEQQRRHKFREELTPEMKAEFIEGQAVMHSPATARHIIACMNLGGLLRAWVVEHRLGFVTMEKALVCLERNDFEPDIAFFSKLAAATVAPTRMEFPTPDFVMEVLSPSTERIDRGIKMEDYAAHGVSEYWLVDCREQAVERYVLNAATGGFGPAGRAAVGERVASSAVRGFSIPVAAIFDEQAQHEALRALLLGSSAAS